MYLYSPSGNCIRKKKLPGRVQLKKYGNIIAGLNSFFITRSSGFINLSGE